MPMSPGKLELPTNGRGRNPFTSKVFRFWINCKSMATPKKGPQEKNNSSSKFKNPFPSGWTKKLLRFHISHYAASAGRQALPVHSKNTTKRSQTTSLKIPLFKHNVSIPKLSNWRIFNWTKKALRKFEDASLDIKFPEKPLQEPGSLIDSQPGSRDPLIQLDSDVSVLVKRPEPFDETNIRTLKSSEYPNPEERDPMWLSTGSLGSNNRQSMHSFQTVTCAKTHHPCYCCSAPANGLCTMHSIPTRGRSMPLEDNRTESDRKDTHSLTSRQSFAKRTKTSLNSEVNALEARDRLLHRNCPFQKNIHPKDPVESPCFYRSTSDRHADIVFNGYRSCCKSDNFSRRKPDIYCTCQLGLTPNESLSSANTACYKKSKPFLPVWSTYANCVYDHNTCIYTTDIQNPSLFSRESPCFCNKRVSKTDTSRRHHGECPENSTSNVFQSTKDMVLRRDVGTSTADCEAGRNQAGDNSIFDKCQPTDYFQKLHMGFEPAPVSSQQKTYKDTDFYVISHVHDRVSRKSLPTANAKDISGLLDCNPLEDPLEDSPSSLQNTDSIKKCVDENPHLKFINIDQDLESHRMNLPNRTAELISFQRLANTEDLYPFVDLPTRDTLENSLSMNCLLSESFHELPISTSLNADIWLSKNTVCNNLVDFDPDKIRRPLESNGGKKSSLEEQSLFLQLNYARAGSQLETVDSGSEEVLPISKEINEKQFPNGGSNQKAGFESVHNFKADTFLESKDGCRVDTQTPECKAEPLETLARYFASTPKKKGSEVTPKKKGPEVSKMKQKRRLCATKNLLDEAEDTGVIVDAYDFSDLEGWNKLTSRGVSKNMAVSNCPRFKSSANRVGHTSDDLFCRAVLEKPANFDCDSLADTRCNAMRPLTPRFPKDGVSSVTEPRERTFSSKTNIGGQKIFNRLLNSNAYAANAPSGLTFRRDLSTRFSIQSNFKIDSHETSHLFNSNTLSKSNSLL